MKRYFSFYFFFLFVVNSFGYSYHRTRTSVLVTDEEQTAVSGADVKIGYRGSSSDEKGNISLGKTDASGVYFFTGTSYDEAFVQVSKPGYYTSIFYRNTHRYNPSLKRYEPVDPEVAVTLKKVINPVPMYARSKWHIKLLPLGQSVGFDLQEHDWVVPYGNGQVIDLVFKITGYYESDKNHDATLTVSFPNEGDGLISFSALENDGSVLLSPQLAPDEGYIATKSWRMYAREKEAKDDIWHRSIETFNSTEKGLNYIIRTRTVLDEEGNVVSANHGKIYGDFTFRGARNDGNFIRVNAIYWNPVSGSKNLEFSVGNSLFSNLRFTETPTLP